MDIINQTYFYQFFKLVKIVKIQRVTRIEEALVKSLNLFSWFSWKLAPITWREGTQHFEGVLILKHFWYIISSIYTSWLIGRYLKGKVLVQLLVLNFYTTKYKKLKSTKYYEGIWIIAHLRLNFKTIPCEWNMDIMKQWSIIFLISILLYSIISYNWCLGVFIISQGLESNPIELCIQEMYQH